MKITRRLASWFESRICTPAYSGWVLGGISICFFGAAINTMAGWLYVISGISCALLVVAAILPPRSLSGLSVTRQPMEAVSAGDDLVVKLEIHNQSKKVVNWLQIEDNIPLVLGSPVSKAINAISPQSSYTWEYFHPTTKRGVYRWHQVDLRSGAPLGLFWCRRSRTCPATAYVYPQVLPLVSCPLIDEIGRDDSRREEWLGTPEQVATEGLVRALRPYRIGDPIRLVHWRSSARYSELRVRELETITGGQEAIIALDTTTAWGETNFESAVTVAASLYFYAQHQGLNVKLWTAATGLVSGNRQVLATLAATNPQEEINPDFVSKTPFPSPIIWLTQTTRTDMVLPPSSRRVLWTAESENNAIGSKLVSDTRSVKPAADRNFPGIVIDPQQPLQVQLQAKI